MPNAAIAPSARDLLSEAAFCQIAEADEQTGDGRVRIELADSDLVLLEPVRDALHSSGYSALRRIEIEIHRGTVVLWGRVPTYHLKQLAQWCVQQVTGVRGVGNGLEVVCSRSSAL